MPGSLHGLPFDVLRGIFSLCNEPRALTETCRYFSTVIYSLPKFCDIHIGDHQLDPDPLRSRLGRISTSLRLVSIGKFQHGVYGSLISGICATLAEFNTEIKQLEINAEFGLDAGYLLSNIFSVFSKPITFPKLQRLSVRVQTEYFSQLPDGTRLAVVLEDAPEKFPNLQTLSLSDFFECIPALRETPHFSNMHTLILDGSNARRSICVNAILSLLKHTPALETLWIKHALDPINTFNGRWESERDWTEVVVLPRLTSLALSVNNPDFLHYIETPALRNLHLDASADPSSWEVTGWNKCSSKAMLDGLTLLAQRSTNLRRLAFTAITLREEDCQWLMFTGPPFPRLESLAIHRLHRRLSGWCPGFDDALLLRGAENQGPMLSLRRLAILSCNLRLTGPVIAQALSTIRLNAFPDDGFELEVDDSGPQFSEEEISTLTEIGVKLIRRGGGDEKTVEWWELGHDIDPLDSHVY